MTKALKAEDGDADELQACIDEVQAAVALLPEDCEDVDDGEDDDEDDDDEDADLD